MKKYARQIIYYLQWYTYVHQRSAHTFRSYTRERLFFKVLKITFNMIFTTNPLTLDSFGYDKTRSIVFIFRIIMMTPRFVTDSHNIPKRFFIAIMKKKLVANILFNYFEPFQRIFFGIRVQRQCNRFVVYTHCCCCLWLLNATVCLSQIVDFLFVWTTSVIGHILIPIGNNDLFDFTAFNP